MARRERDILEHAVHVAAEQAAKADDLINEAMIFSPARGPAQPGWCVSTPSRLPLPPQNSLKLAVPLTMAPRR